jgi:crotonobetainyl-CoA:carnitine CoA-transferase CaiB-like acyl-CoA transferase
MVARPMSGVRVVEVAQYTYVPSAGAVLAEWGADVIKVEHAVHGDGQRGFGNMGAFAAGGRFAPLMEHANRGKRSIGLALEHPEALGVLYDLVRGADVFLTNFLGDARARLKIDVADIRAVNPDIIYVRGTALGVRGPEADRGGYDSPTFWCRGGSALGATPPDMGGVVGQPGPAYGDSIGGMTIAGGIAAALFARAQTGEPSVVDVSLLSVGAWSNALAIDLSLMSGESWRPPELSAGNAGALRNPLVGMYRTADGRYINLNMMQPGKYWADTCQHLGREDLLTDDRFSSAEKIMDNATEAARAIGETIIAGSYAFWVERLQTLAGQWAPVQDSVEAGQDAQLRANGYFADLTDVDGVTQTLVTNPVQFDEVPAAPVRGPQFAEHTDEILAESGRDEQAVIDLKISGAVA